MNDESETKDFNNHRIRIAEETLNLEKEKFEYDRRFFNRNQGVIITSIVTLTAIIFSYFQFLANQSRIQEQQELKAISFIIDQIDSNKDQQSLIEKFQYVRNVIDAAVPENIANKVISRIDRNDLFLHQLKDWSANQQALNKRKVVLLLDTNYPPNDYSETQKRLGGTNADDIFEILSHLHIWLIRDVIKSNWENEVLIYNLKPKLVIVHRDCFEYNLWSFFKSEDRFEEFIKKIKVLKKIGPELVIKPYYMKNPCHFWALINAVKPKKEVVKELGLKEDK
jgi:hypothetical protein